MGNIMKKVNLVKECPLGNKHTNQSDCYKTVFDALYY